MYIVQSPGSFLPFNHLNTLDNIILNGLFSLSLNQINHFKINNDRLLDLVFMNYNECEVFETDALVNQEVHHCAISMILPNMQFEELKPTSAASFNFSKTDYRF